MPDLLVSGASGRLGQAVLRHLLDTLGIPANRIAAASRDPAKLEAFTQRGVEARRADFDDPASLGPAFAGIKRLLLISTDALDGTGTRLRQHKAAVKAAAEAGVEHVVYTSLPAAERSLVTFGPDHAGTEQAITASGIRGWTILRNNWYFENLFMSLPSALASGTWYSAAGEGRLPYIARDDLALAAAVALSSDFQGQRTLTLGGEHAYTARQVAALVADATGKPLRVVDVPVEGLVQGMMSAGFPEAAARTVASFDENARAGLFEGDATDFEALTGRKPQPFEPWVKANAGNFAKAQAH